MVTYLVVYRGDSVESVKPFVVCTDSFSIRQIAKLLSAQIPSAEKDPVIAAKRKGLKSALRMLAEECSQ